jgi:hypothetical protein
MNNALGRMMAWTVGLVAAAAPTAVANPPYPQWPLPRNTPMVDSGRRGMNPPSEFGLFYSHYADRTEWFNLDTSGIPYRMDIVLISATSTPTYPMAGAHMIEMYPGGHTAFYNQFLQELRSIVTSWIPDAEYDGLLVLDYEYFSPNWTGHRNTPSTEARDAIDWDNIDDWRETLRDTRPFQLAGMTPAQQEAYFRQEYLATTREFFERTFNEVKQLRPRAKVAFYNQPCQSYWPYRDPVQAAALRQGDSEESQWFFDMVDVICPSVYPLYESVPDSQTPGAHQDRERDFDSYVRANITEALRLAHGKPVYPYVTYQYHPSVGPLGYLAANPYNATHAIEVARELGCNGVVLWSWFQRQQEYDSCRPMVQNVFAPFMRQMAQLSALAPANPAPVGGGGGLAGGTGGTSGSGSSSGSSGSGSGSSSGTGGTSGTGGGGGGGTGGSSAVGPGGGAGSGSGVITVGGGGGGSSGSGSSGSGSSSGSSVVSVGGGSSSSAAAGGGGSSGGGSSGGGSGGASGAGGGGTAIAGGSASGMNVTGYVSTYRNDGAGASGMGSSFAGSGSGWVTSASLAGGSLPMPNAPVLLGGDQGVAVVPGVDMQGAEIHTAPADAAGMELAKNRTLGLGDGATNLDGARIVRPGTDEPPVVLTARNSDEKIRIVKPGMEGGYSVGGTLASNRAADSQPFRIVRPGGATGAGAAGALLSTAQLAQGGRFVKPGQGADAKPVEKLPPTMVITDAPSPQP